MSLHAVHDDWAMPVAATLTAAPAAWPAQLADVAAAVARPRGVPAPLPAEPGADAQAVAAAAAVRRAQGDPAGQRGGAAPAGVAAAGAGALDRPSTPAPASATSAKPATASGAQLVGALPGPGGLNAGQMLTQPMKALLLLNTEPVLDGADAAAARQALAGSGLVVALTPFKDAAADVADVMLPIAPFTETAGTFVNAEGRVQSFHGVVKPLGDTRPAWKVLRVLGNLLGLRRLRTTRPSKTCAPRRWATWRRWPSRLDNRRRCRRAAVVPAAGGGLQRVADVPIYAVDSLVRRAASLQLTADARAPVVGLPSALWRQLGMAPGGQVLVTQGSGAVVLPAREDELAGRRRGAHRRRPPGHRGAGCDVRRASAVEKV